LAFESALLATGSGGVATGPAGRSAGAREPYGTGRTVRGTEPLGGIYAYAAIEPAPAFGSCGVAVGVVSKVNGVVIGATVGATTGFAFWRFT